MTEEDLKRLLKLLEIDDKPIDRERIAELDSLDPQELTNRWYFLGERLHRIDRDRFNELYAAMRRFSPHLMRFPAPADPGPDDWCRLEGDLFGVNSRERIVFGAAMFAMEQSLIAAVKGSDRLVDRVTATEGQPLQFSHAEHAEHCRIAECTHPARYSESSQLWCARCHAVADDGLTTEMVRERFGHGPS